MTRRKQEPLILRFCFEYRNSPKYWDTLSTYHTCLENFIYARSLQLLDVSKILLYVWRFAVSDPGLHCLQRTIGPNTVGFYGDASFHIANQNFVCENVSAV